MIRTPLTSLLGISCPIISTGMGYVSGARLAAAASQAGGLGIIASATMSPAELRRGHQGSQGPDQRPVRGEPARRRPRRRRADRGDHRGAGAGRLVRARPPAGADREPAGRGGDHHRVGGRPAARGEGGSLGHRRRDRNGRRGRRAHRLGTDEPADPPGRRRGRHPGDRGGWFLRRPGPGRRAGLRGRRDRDGHPVPADQRQPGGRRGQAGLPGQRRHRHGRHHPGRRGAAPGAADAAGRAAGGGRAGARAAAVGPRARPRSAAYPA